MMKQMHHKKTILVLASTFPRWAHDTTPPFVFELEKRLTQDFTIFVLAPHFQGAKKYERIDNLNIIRFQYFWPASAQKLCYEGGILPNIQKNKWLFFEAITFLFFEYIAAVKIIKKEKIRLIHAHWIIPQGFIALLLKKQFHIPYIVTTHGGDIYGLQNSLLQSWKKSILKNAAKITVVSSAIKEVIHKKINPSLSITVLPMGVDAQLFTPNASDKSLKEKFKMKGPFLLFIGRLAEKKGVRYLLDSMPAIVQKFPTVTLLIIGEGNLKKELEEYTVTRNITQYVFFLGALSNAELPKYYATADIFIGPSIQTKDGDTEGLGLTFVEASLSGCVPIGTRIGGIADVIRDTETGYLVEEKNAQEIASAVLKLLDTPQLLTIMKHKAREFTQNKFDWAIITGQYKELYESTF